MDNSPYSLKDRKNLGDLALKYEKEEKAKLEKTNRFKKGKSLLLRHATLHSIVELSKLQYRYTSTSNHSMLKIQLILPGGNLITMNT